MPSRSRAMALPPHPPIPTDDSLIQSWISQVTAWLLHLCYDGYDAAAFMSARHKDPNQRTLRDIKTYYRGLEQDGKDGKQDSHNLVEQSKQSHDKCIVVMNKPSRVRSWAMPPPRTSFFILDSGATSHVVGDVSLLSPSFRSRTTATPAATAAATAYQAQDGRVLTVAGVGTVSCDNFHIPDVLCVPDLRTGLNLVSVQQLAECDYLVMFGGGQCSVMEQSSGKIAGKGRLHADDGLYHLEFLHIPHDDKACDCDDTTAS